MKKETERKLTDAKENREEADKYKKTQRGS